MRNSIIVLDFGSQYAHLITKRFRMLGYWSEIALPSADISELKNAKGIVFSGGPSSVYEEAGNEFNTDILHMPIPILGICYGHQLMAKELGGKVGKAATSEFGITPLNACKDSPLFKNIIMPTHVCMSHQDEVLALAPGFECVGFTKDCQYAAVQNIRAKRFGLQCHIEVTDTPAGNKILENFAEFCTMKKNWKQDDILETILTEITDCANGTRVKEEKKVLLFLSGGVDSTVAFALLNKALGQDRVLGLHIDNGFMRKNESKKIAKTYKKAGFVNFIVEDASDSFLQSLYKLTDPQKKRMAVGEHYITVRDSVVKKLNLDESTWLLAQGTLYPDIIESGGGKNAHVIKTHHNRVDGIQKLIEKGLIIEPLKDLYKDEVRTIGKKIGLCDKLVMRHPFPGPGLSINVLCTDGKLSDKEEKELEDAKKALISFDNRLDALPVKSVGVQGDFRTYRFPAVLRIKNTTKNLLGTHTWESLEEFSRSITNTIKNVNRTVLCLYERNSTKELVLQEGYCEKGRLDQTRECDAIVLDELYASGWYHKIFQHLTINIPYATQKNHCSIILRPVVSEDVMTARFAPLDTKVLARIVKKIAKRRFVDAVYFDITNKPPATFGWE
ncbi:MAG TPA: glutamine-hydrolyzing GMP synthase [Treponemataceae bacterium]|nr:glutamine-hydrolyzing GMP synthase [Treponemataceae bacterium]